MANEIKDKFASSTALTVTLASLANAAGRQSTIIDNTTNRYGRVALFVKVKMAAAGVTANSVVEVYLIRDDNDGTNHRSDGAGASDAAVTILNAALIGILRNGTSPNGTTIYGEFVVDNVGPKWGIAVVNRTGAALDATGSNHWARYVGINPEVQ
jgi:hypothetical protein